MIRWWSRSRFRRWSRAGRGTATRSLGSRAGLLGRRRRTNAENLGEPVYRWYRLAGYEPQIAGRAWCLGELATIWHVEPGGCDAFTVCRRKVQRDDGSWSTPHPNRWKWHVHHWHISFRPGQRWHRFLFERCSRCGHRFPFGYAPISNSWYPPKPKHWWSMQRTAQHHECSSVGHYEHTVEQDKRLIRLLFNAYRTVADLDEAEALARLTDPSRRSLEFIEAYRLTGILGYERDDDYNLVAKANR